MRSQIVRSGIAAHRGPCITPTTLTAKSSSPYYRRYHVRRELISTSSAATTVNVGTDTEHVAVESMAAPDGLSVAETAADAVPADAPQPKDSENIMTSAEPGHQINNNIIASEQPAMQERADPVQDVALEELEIPSDTSRVDVPIATVAPKAFVSPVTVLEVSSVLKGSAGMDSGPQDITINAELKTEDLISTPVQDQVEQSPPMLAPTPLLDALSLRAHQSQDVPFHVPGHKVGRRQCRKKMVCLTL
jgi:hypothetical protein